MDYYCKTTRSMLANVKEVGAMPFILFEYYLTWASAPNGIKPPLQRISDDLGLEKNNICNLRKKLIDAGWIRFENDEVFILKSFTKNENNHSQKMNDSENSFTKNESDSQKMNESFTKNESAFILNEQTFILNESPLKEENKQELKEERTGEERESNSIYPEASPVPKSAPAPKIFENKFVRRFWEFFPEQTLSENQIRVISNRIRDGTVWNQALEFWAANNYRSESVGKICDRYDEIIEENEVGRNGYNNFGRKRSEADIIESSRHFYENYPS